MTLNLTMPGQDDLKPRITVFGVGGAGGNAVNNMIEKCLDGVDFVVANTDAQALSQSNSEHRIQLGVKVTEGLGAGAKASIGAAAAEESIEQIVDHLAGAHMCFITAGMGGGTGTGGAPIIAQAARELGVLTVGVVTKPFQFEGAKRMRLADDGVEALQKVVDTLIIIPNQNLFRLANEKTTFTEAFSMADDVLYQGVKGVTDLMVRPGLINLDFADVRAVMDEMGKAMMGTGEADGEDRAIQAAEKAIANPLLDEISLKGARGVLINITGGHDLTLFELDEAANRIREEVDPEANIIVGSTLDTVMEGAMRVSVVATGIDMNEAAEIPIARRKLSEPLKPADQAVEAAAAIAPVPFDSADTAPRAMPDDVWDAPAVGEAEGGAATAEPGLFDAEQAAAEEQMEDIFAADEASGDDLPPPAYDPAPDPDFEHAGTPDDPDEAFVAPGARTAPGTPSPEALRRLRSAVENAPGASGGARQQPHAQHDTGIREDDAALQQARGRFGINSLINRMTGHGDEGDSPQRSPRQQPSLSTGAARSRSVAADQTGAEEEDQIEIPAFLRRQAN